MLSNGDAKPTQNWCEMGIVKFLIGRLSFVVEHMRVAFIEKMLLIRCKM